MKTSKHTFFCEHIDGLKLSKEEAHHALKVLRLSKGQPINVTDGKGILVNAEIEEINKQGLTFSIIKRTQQPSPSKNIHIAIAPTKSNERIEFFIEKAVEIGISEITPILSSNSERKVIKPERWQKIIVSAAKQSGNLHFPKLNDMVSFSSFIGQSHKNESAHFIAHCDEDDDKYLLINSIGDSKNICILIGPEGDFTSEEINLAKENNFKPVSLGKTRLRTETAGIVACHTVNLAQ